MKVIASTDRAFKGALKRITSRSNRQGGSVEIVYTVSRS